MKQKDFELAGYQIEEFRGGNWIEVINPDGWRTGIVKRHVGMTMAEADYQLRQSKGNAGDKERV